MIHFEKEDFEKVQTKDEKNLEERFLNLLHKDNIWAKKMICTIDGYPDIKIVTNKTILVELKSFEYKIDKKLTSIFKPTQPPFYYEYCTKTKANNLFVLFEAIKDNVKTYWVLKMTQHIAKHMSKVTFNDLIMSADRMYVIDMDMFSSLKLAVKHVLGG